MSVKVEEMFRYYTRKAGELGRGLALVGGGIIWLLHKGIAEEHKELSTSLPFELKVALALIFLSLFLDILQYVVGIVQWGTEFRENSATDAQQKGRPVRTAVSFIYIKLGFMAVAYIFIGLFVFYRTALFGGC